MFSLCEERICADSMPPDACVLSFVSAAMTAREALQTFLTLQRIR
jgi:hypothetical protein